jgi:RNA polymerase sigma-70 factor (sigma-E family)
MTTHDDMTPRQPDENEQLEELFGDALDLVDETVARITDAEVNEYLRKALGQAGYTGRLTGLWQPGSTDVPDVLADLTDPIVLGPGTVADMVAAAKANAKLSSERLQQAQEALEVARDEAKEIVAAAHEEADEVLKLAAKMVREAREQAERIISDARREARQIQLSWMQVIEADRAPELEVGEPLARTGSLRPQDQPDILYVGKIQQSVRANTLFAMADVAVMENYDLAASTHHSSQAAVPYDTGLPCSRPKEMNGFLTVTPAEWSADRAVTEMYSLHYRALVRLAALLVRDTPTAEEVVQDSFVAMHGGWQRLRNAEKGLAYLRQAVVNRARSTLRHRTVVDKNLQEAQPDMPNAEHGALVLLERHAVVAALRKLPERQREVIVLRYYADLSEAEIATAMGISRGAVKSHTARGMTALRAALEQE